MNITRNIDYTEPIAKHFNDEAIFVCLFPFEKVVFADHYDWRYKLNITLPLIETVSWEEVSKKIGFNNFKRIALGVGIRGTLQD